MIHNLILGINRLNRCGKPSLITIVSLYKVTHRQVPTHTVAQAGERAQGLHVRVTVYSSSVTLTRASKCLGKFKVGEILSSSHSKEGAKCC